MKNIGSAKSLILASVVAVALSVGAGVANAQTSVCKGKFILPFKAQWGKMVLPAGEYTYTLDKANINGRVTIRQGDKTIGTVTAVGFWQGNNLKQSELLAVDTGSVYRIRALRLAGIGVAYSYSVPEETAKLMARNPEFVHQISVSHGGM